MNTFIIAMSLSLAALTAPLLALVSAPPAAGDPVLVISGTDSVRRARMIRDAGGQVISPLPGILGTLAISRDPDFLTSLREEGAWLLADGRSISTICGG